MIGLAEHGRLRRVLVKHARDAFVSKEQIDSQWKQLNYTAAPDFSNAVKEYDRFVEILSGSGAEVVALPRVADTNLDSIYTRDAAVVTPAGVVLCGMGKAARAEEP